MNSLRNHLVNVIDKTWNFAGRLQGAQDHQMNALVGLASEAGETLDIGKKMWFHTPKPFEYYRPKLVLELGDILYYFLKVLDVFEISLTEVIDGNRAKLESRHPELGMVTERFGKDAIK